MCQGLRCRATPRVPASSPPPQASLALSPDSVCVLLDAQPGHLHPESDLCLGSRRRRAALVPSPTRLRSGSRSGSKMASEPHIKAPYSSRHTPGQRSRRPKRLQGLRIWIEGACWQGKSWAGDKQVQVPWAQKGGQGLWKKKVVSGLGLVKAGSPHPQETNWDPKRRGWGPAHVENYTGVY